MTAPVRCSFCGKSQHEVRQVIAGPAVHICDECVSICCEIVRQNGHDTAPPAFGRVELANLRLRAFELLKGTGEAQPDGSIKPHGMQMLLQNAEALAGWALDSAPPEASQSNLTADLAHALSLARPLLECAPERFRDRIAQIDAALERAEAAGLGRKECGNGQQKGGME